MRRHHGRFRNLADLWGHHPAGITPLALALFGNRRHPVIGRQSDDVVVTADLPIERVEEAAEGVIQSEQRVMHFGAVRAEIVADTVEPGETDAEQIDRLSLTQVAERRFARSPDPPDRHPQRGCTSTAR